MAAPKNPGSRKSRSATVGEKAPTVGDDVAKRPVARKKVSSARAKAKVREGTEPPSLVDVVPTAEFRDSRPPLPASHSLRVKPSVEPWGAQAVRRPAISHRGQDLGFERDAVRQSVLMHVEYTQGKDELSATAYDYFCATARAVRDRIVDRWNKTAVGQGRGESRTVYLLSLEYLLGRSLEDALVALGMLETMREVLGELGLDLSVIAQTEPDAALGHGGLGRFAACLLESMATVGISAMGYGIRYEFGSFEQQLTNGRQHERADNWLRYGSPWELLRPETRYLIRFGGHVEVACDGSGRQIYRWRDGEQIWAVACDYLIPGYGGKSISTLRLWTARATRGFGGTDSIGEGYVDAVEDKSRSENLSRVLYPSDDGEPAREGRLKQEYFFVAATLQDVIARHMSHNSSLDSLPEQAVLQLNDTRTGLAIAELMRLLVDEYGFGWEEAWGTTTRSFAYTNHSVLKEALETWPVALLERLLPRHLQIVYEINRRFLEEVRQRFPGDEERVVRMSLVEEAPVKRLRLAHLCVVGSFVTNGVSEQHGRILRDSLFRDFAENVPQKFVHVTSGITVRRWLRKSNVGLSNLIISQIGEQWVTDAQKLRRLGSLAADSGFREQWRRVKCDNKERLALVLRHAHHLTFDPSSVLFVNMKRLHESERQLLSVLHLVSLYLNYRAQGAPTGTVKRTFLFAGKAAPGSAIDKDVIELIGAVGRTIARDPRVRDFLEVLFVPNHSVSLAELIVPAADVSEQISLAGTEVSATGNLKLALNGALTIGTADGPNLELADAVGLKNLFLFGLTSAEVEGMLRRGYDPRRIYSTELEVRAAIDAIGRGVFTPDQPGRFGDLVQSLLASDRFLVLADFISYRNCHKNVLAAWATPDDWTRRSIMNTCNIGRFSSDEVVRSYARDIWKVTA